MANPSAPPKGLTSEFSFSYRLPQPYNRLMNELAKSLISNSAFAAPSSILQGIPEALAQEKLVVGNAAAPHSIYTEVWHMAYWQDLSLDWVEGRPTRCPEHAAEGFPSDNNEAWNKLCERFLTGAQNAAAIANDTDRLEISVLCPSPGDPARRMTVREQLESLAAHNSYHLGRIVLMRQLLGSWPPSAGGFTW
jgi:uncharacterized damage-inducible protein DinB